MRGVGALELDSEHTASMAETPRPLHDLRNLLAVVIGRAELIADVTPKMACHTDAIIEAAERARRILDGLAGVEGY